MSNKKNSQISDNDLIEKFRLSHDSLYVGELYNRYAHLVLGLCFKYLKNESAAQDAAMDIFEILVKELKKHKIDFFKSWLYSVSKNHCLQLLRKDTVQLKKKAAYEKFLTETMENSSFFHLNNTEGEKEKHLLKMEDALLKLKFNQQECLKLFYLKGKTYVEIAEETGYSLKEIKSYIQNGKRNLKIKMLEEDTENE